MTRYPEASLGSLAPLRTPAGLAKGQRGPCEPLPPWSWALNLGGLKDALYVDIKELPLHSSFKAIGVLWSCPPGGQSCIQRKTE